MNKPEKNIMIQHKKNIRSVKKTRLSLRPLSTSIRMLLTGSIVLGGLTVSSNATAALPLPKPPGAWATRSALALPQVSASWSRINDKLWRSGTTEAQYGDKTLTVKQKDGKVILSWDSFDIDVSHLVEFKQPNSNSIALNRISNLAPPSRILGTLKANGQIYLINNNGFLFGANSVVDVNTLVVSTLNISDDVFKRGITKVFTGDGSAAFNGNGDVYLRDPKTRDYIRDAAGDRLKIGIHVDKGAQISSDNYGRVIMVAPEITNRGTITSPDGQVILAAATDQVYLQETDSGDSVRGLNVGLKTGGEVSNQGNIITPRGNTTLMGFAVNQQGLISATTSVRVNGSIILRAAEKAGIDTTRTDKTVLLPASSTTRAKELDDSLGTQAKAILADGSVTRVLPEIDDKTAMAEDPKNPPPPSSIEVMGKMVHFKSGSAVIAPSGEVNVLATQTPASPDPTATENDSAIIMDSGSLIDVAGLKSVEKTMESNVIDVELRANVLADAPVQKNKNSILYGKKISVDIREGTPLANIQPALDGIKTTIAERSVEGGRVSFSSQGRVTLKKGSTVNISGGAIHYKAGYINTTQLLGEDGKTYDISEANPDLRYTGILGQVSKEYKKWGVTKTWKVAGPFNKGRFESAYTDGQKAGVFTIKAHKLLQDGDIVAKTFNGRRQRLARERVDGGTLDVNLAFLGGKYQTLVFQNNKDLNSPDLDMLKQNQGNSGKSTPPLIIDADSFRRNGLQKVTYTTNGQIVLPKNLDMSLSDGGSFSLTSERNSIDVAGKITGHGTNVSLRTTYKDQNVVLGKNALIDTSGRWVNDSLAVKPMPDFKGVFIDAGKVTMTSEQASVIMNKGSLIRANSGAWLTDVGELKTGKGGDVSLLASSDPNANGRLILDGTVEGFSFADSGAFSLSAPEFRFVPTIPDNGGGTPSVPGPVYIPETFVEKSGFSSYKFRSTRNGITFESGVLLKPSQQNLVLNGRDVLSTVSASDVSSVSIRQRLADEVRQPVDLTFTYKDPSPLGNLQQTKAIYMQSGSRIQAEVGAKIHFGSSSSIYINGDVQAPAGQITLDITKFAGRGADPGYIPAQGIWLGSDSVLSTAGTFVPTYNIIPDIRQGRLLAGGKVALDTKRGFIVMDKGALIDVSGASTIVDQPDTTYQGPGERLLKIPRASDAGEVSLAGAEGIILGGEILGRAKTDLGAEGGRLKIKYANRQAIAGNATNATPFIKTPRKIIISKTRSQKLAAIPRQGEAITDETNGYAWLDSALLNQSGFGSIDLNAGNIIFTGDSSIVSRREVMLSTLLISWQKGSTGNAGLAAILSPYVALGSDGTGIVADAISGNGHLQVDANMIDLIGGVSLQGFDLVQLNSNTDIRVRGRQHVKFIKGAVGRSKSLTTPGQWNTRGRFELNADKVYPATLSDYSINADQVVIAKHHSSKDELRTLFGSDADTIIDNISRPHQPAPLLSAGGRLAIKADTITQAGELRAPLGEISLKADSRLTLEAGSLTSTSAQGQVIPLGQTAQSGQDWQYNFSKGDTLRILRPPEKRILLSSDDVRLNKGAVIDMNGGGDLQAWEFIKGPGGSHDIFDSSGTAFAVLPGFNQYAPYDKKESRAAGFKPGDTVYLSAIGDLPAGEYARLPARYALLDGAYLVTPLTGYTGMIPGETTQLMDRTPVVAGQNRVAGTGIHDQDWNGFKVETRQQARLHSEILLTRANRFYTDQALANETLLPFLPQDAGQLGITALSRLDLASKLRNQAEGTGRGGRLDIEATNLAVVSQRSAPGVNRDRVELLAGELSQLGMESLLLGGIRKQTDAGTKITVATKTVSVETNTGNNADKLDLQGTEILLAAQDSIDLKPGVTVQAKGKGGLGADTLIVKGDGALVRVSAGAQVSVSRTGSKGDKGTINLDKGARLAASSAVLLDASHEININGKLKINHGSLNLGAGRINLGDAPISATGLLLNRDLLDSLNLRELVMTGRQGIYTYGDVNLNFDSMVFDGAGIVSQGNAGNRLTIQSDRLRFTNSGSDKVSKDDLALAAGDAFTIKAREIELGKGEYTLAGFNKVSMAASERIIGKGKSTINIKADVDLKTPLITTGSGADTRIDATDQQFVISQLATDKPLAAAGIGGRLSISADSISDRSTILLPAGILELNATRKLLIDNALIDVSGVSKSFQGEIKTAPGGSVILVSEQAGVELAKTAHINLSAADEGGDAGSLKVDTPQAEFIWQGTVSATATKGKGGRFELNEQSMSSPFSLLNSKLAGAGFDEAVSLRLGQGDIAIAQADTLRAHEVKLTSDTGNVNVVGAIDARGKDGGRVELSAGDNVTLSGRIDARAVADDGDGGTVKLTTLDNDQDGIGEIDITGNIDVSSRGKGKGGEVWYRARRIDSNNDGQNDEVAIAHAGTVTGAAVVNYVPVRTYDDVSIIDKNRINQWQNDNQAYMAFSDAMASRLNVNGNNQGRVLPSSFVRSNGDMTIDTDIDFSGWRYGNDKTPGEIIFSAKNNLLINADISDGFKDTTFYGGYALLNDRLMTGESWSYGMVAGADRQSANPMDVNKGVGDITLADNTKIRTGTGSIDFASGNDMIFSNAASVIYTAGQAVSDGSGFSLLNFVALSLPYMEYPRNGGDIRIRTGGNMKGVVSKQSIRAWLKSTGNWSRKETHKGEIPTSWGLGLTEIKFYDDGVSTPVFQRGIGALGGGNVDIEVAGDMQDVSVVIPTSGKPLGKSSSLSKADFNNNQIEISGGGSLKINAGGNINGGMFYLGRGEGAIRSDGGLLKGSNDRYPVFSMGDTQFNIISRKDIGIGAVFDPLMERPTSGDSYFFSYSSASAFSVTSVAGDVRLANNSYYNDTDKSSNYGGYNNDGRKYFNTIYPASLSASSLNGDVVLDNGFTLFPSAVGQLELLATDNIKGIIITDNAVDTIPVFMSDADPALLQNIKFPFINDNSVLLDAALYNGLAIPAVKPLHTGDNRPVRVVAESGSISRLLMNVPKKTEVYAGQDIRNSSFTIQNIAAEDRSRIVAGRDLRYDIPRNDDGSVINGDPRKVEVSGPGQLIVQAGRNIDLGASLGISSVGNVLNPALADRGADVILIAGVKNNVDYAGFSKTYINQSNKYIAALRTFVNDGVIDFDQTAGVTVLSAQADSVRKTFAGFTQQKQRAFLRELFLREIREVGVKSAKAGGNFYQPAYDAIASLFPGSYTGDIKLFFSQISTLDGGDIQLLAPGGGVNAGLASSAGLSKGADKLGVIVQREGNIDAFVRDDFAVNVSRVFTLGGGDIMLFASEGDIDAGRGAKSSLAAPLPTVTFNKDGNPVVEFPPAIQGSGIRTFASGKIKAGDVYLFAPQGKIDAGDAGIGGNDITLGAPTIIGSGNIDIGGVSVGVPTASVSLAAGLTGVSNLSASSNKVAEESTSSIGRLSENSGFGNTPMGFLNVELVGFGGGVTNASSSNSSSKITRKK